MSSGYKHSKKQKITSNNKANQYNNNLPSKEDVKSIISWGNYSTNRKKYYFFLFIWLYFSLRLFITDIDLRLSIKHFNTDEHKYILFRFFLIWLLLLGTWIAIGNKRFWKNIGLIALFPFYPILFSLAKFFIWKLPENLIKYKKYYLLLAYIDTLILFLVKFKSTLFWSIFFVLSVMGMVSLQSYWLIIPGLGFLLLLLRIVFNNYNEISEPVRLFQINVKSIKLNFSKEAFEKDLQNSTSSTARKDEVKVSQIEHFLLIHTFSNVLNQKVSDILSSRSYFKRFALKGLFAILVSIIYVSGLNYTLYKFDSNHFLFVTPPNYFNFFFYSFFTIFPDGVDLQPNTEISKSIKMIGVFVGLAINVLVFIVYVTVINDKYKENLGELVDTSERYSKEIGDYFNEKYDKNIVDGYEWLKLTGSSLAHFLEEIKKIIEKSK